MPYEGRAAVLNEAGRDVELEDITLEDPGPGEVLVKMVASGVCHTDLHVKNMNGMGMAFPILLGHEGAGIIEAVGEGVTNLKPGDPVVIAYRAPCEQCPACLRGDPRRCWVALRPKQRIRRKRDGALLSQVLRCGTFSTHTVVHSKAAIKMPAEMPLDKACLIACGVITGVGAALNTAPIFAGANVAVFGCGGVGISVIQGAKLAHAKRIIAVDLSERKLEWAKNFGATDVVNASQGDPVARVREIADGVGVDFAYEAVGIPKTIEQSIASLAYAGTAVHIGLPEDEQHVNLNFGNMDTGVYWNKATIKVCHCGDALPSNDFPLLAQLYLQGQLKLDEMVTATTTLDKVNEAFHAMEGGDVLRSVILF
ncbi:oxidoreductase [Capsulimonas corticalis]|uniref:Oxidoreductase n=1 Tax=Capsulimonas corticalis TaxID=2219043 RepID=A0A402CPI1_9BACT|nr:Zn-dependent alcohol dehydrogenase [Capsulimonas corticalis]BDI33037.1 oxidoreductase [Capsulimonas corticalis]